LCIAQHCAIHKLLCHWCSDVALIMSHVGIFIIITLCTGGIGGPGMNRVYSLSVIF